MVSVTEQWRKIPGCEYYEASNLGRVKSLARLQVFENKGKEFRRRWPEKIMKPTKHRTGYMVLRIVHDGNLRWISVHQLVALAFIGHPNELTVNHKDGNKENNCIDNLEYITLSENMVHAHKTGLNNVRGENNPAAKLSENVVRQIRKLLGGRTRKQIAAIVGCSKSCVDQVASGKTWKHVI